jgi:predicted ATPase/class 3 adenylate cyclase
MAEMPRGTVAFLFTDVENSSALWERDGAAMMTATARHVSLLREAAGAHGGVLFKTVGDGTQSAFPTAPAALSAALAAQLALLAEPWPDELGPLRACMAIHAGEAEPREGDYLAAPLNRLSRLLGMARGGQILVTEAVEQLAQDGLPPGGSLQEVGEMRLRDLNRAERVFVLVHRDLPHDIDLPVASDERTRHFPPSLTPFLGREAEISAIAKLVTAPNVHLVTLTGPGGIGKTRLAIQVGERLASSFAGGAVFVDLAPLRDPAQVLPAIATALGLREVSIGSLVNQVHGFLAERETLLILDNFEQLLGSAVVVANLLGGSDVELLVTSRAPLRVQGEHEYLVPTLRLPDQTQRTNAAALATNEAVALFVDRARAVRPDFELTDAIAPIVAEICARLDGLPLAIELAAARIKVLPPAALLSRLERRLPLLTGGRRDAPERQRTLRDTIAWSYDLLAQDECQLFRRLGVFVGGWTMEAAEAVANPEGQLDVLGGLTSLVEMSLVRLDERESEPRFRMLETIREYAVDRLSDAGEDAAMRERHAAFYLDFAETAEPELVRANQVEWLDRLAVDGPNITVALSWLLDQNRIEEGLRLAVAMRFFWLRRAPFSEGSRWLTAFLERATTGVPPRIRARAVAAAGSFKHWLGHLEETSRLYQDALALFREAGDLIGEARLLRNLASVAIDLGQLDEAEALLAESRSVADRSGNPRSVADVVGLCGTLAFAQGDYDQASAQLKEASDRYRDLGDVASLMDATGDAGYMTALSGDAVEAAKFFAESLTLAVDLEARDRISWALLGAGNLAAQQGDAALAVRLFAAATAIQQSMQEDLRPSVDVIQERILREQRQSLGESDYLAAWEEGRALPQERAIAEARTVLSAVTTGDR